MDITVRDLSTMDEVGIRTRHSEYRFRITDPHLCRGILTGGMFGEQEHDAVLTGAPLPADLESQMNSRSEIGAQALFYVAVKESVNLFDDLDNHGPHVGSQTRSDFHVYLLLKRNLMPARTRIGGPIVVTGVRPVR
jgi:hypothetical protein